MSRIVILPEKIFLPLGALFNQPKFNLQTDVLRKPSPGKFTLLPADLIRLVVQYLDPRSVLQILKVNTIFIHRIFNLQLWYYLYIHHLSAKLQFKPYFSIFRSAYAGPSKDNTWLFIRLAAEGYEIAAVKYYRRMSMSLFFKCENSARRRYTAYLAKHAPYHVLRYLIDQEIISMSEAVVFGALSPNMTHKQETAAIFICSRRADLAKYLLDQDISPNFQIYQGMCWFAYAYKHKLLKILPLLASNPNVEFTMLKWFTEKSIIHSVSAVFQALLPKTSPFIDLLAPTCYDVCLLMNRKKCLQYLRSICPNLEPSDPDISA